MPDAETAEVRISTSAFGWARTMRNLSGFDLSGAGVKLKQNLALAASDYV
jgi:hypothetical protein